MRRGLGTRVLATLVLAMAGVLLSADGGHDSVSRPDGGQGFQPLALAQATDWRRAVPGRVLSVPADHVSHPDYRLEWWYYTGNVADAKGRAYGYQVTFFRYGLIREPASRSPWAMRDLFMAHVAVTDRTTGVHVYEDRINRAGLHWAGARTDRYEVWNETWRVSLDDDGRHHLAIDAETFALDLRLEPGKPVVLQGDRGYSRKGSDPGNASHYYSLTRMPTSGTLRVGERTAHVTGASWMDHEFGSVRSRRTCRVGTGSRCSWMMGAS